MKRDKFGEWMSQEERKKGGTVSSYKNFIDDISKHYSKENNDKIDLYKYNIDDIRFIKELEGYYDIGGKYEKFGQKDKGGPRAAIKAYVRFLENKPKQPKRKEPTPASGGRAQPPEQSLEIFARAMKRIKDINRKSKNRNEGSIFNPSVYEYVEEIEESFTSYSIFNNLTEHLYRIIFKDFILNLYIIIYETTREKNPNRKPPYDYKLHKFLIDGKPIKDFFYIVGTLRHHYAHLEPEYKDKVSINKKSYGDVLKKLLGSRDEPKSRGDFQRLQIEVLKLFEEAMESLLEMLKDD